MSETCPTVRIKTDANEDGFIVINEHDFDEKVHSLVDAEEATASMTVAQLRESLTDKGVSFEPGAKKAELRALFDAS